ncbi:EamA family transporter, partial [Saccharomonospora sp.]|uniref:EamA family transporter n=1 Tax=Saccharomonospora sp. TaxID=33913 RepID=UPI00262A0B29
VLGTVVGSGIWTVLLSRNPASTVAPFSLLVPVVGLTAAFVVLGERPTVVELAACVVVVGGVLLGSLSRRPRRPVQAETGSCPDSARGVKRPDRMSSA